uniref:HAP1 N-terminal domain-containing protein n=1 Tax=Strongyloides venezuelensis TaxID=75913 RepID=A0A0K0F6D9_STRVS
MDCTGRRSMMEENNNAVDLKSSPFNQVLIYLKNKRFPCILSIDQFLKVKEYFEDDILEELMSFDLTARQERLIKQDNAQRLSEDSALFQNYLQSPDKPYITKNITENQKRMEDEVVKVIRILEEKEKDLELAAKIGKSLLDQNQELRDRNSFLNDSLAKSADVINELKHQVQYKEKLIRSIKKDDDIEVIENEKNTNTSLDYLKTKVDGLKKENNFLINATKELKTLRKNFEEEKRVLVEEHTRRLDKVNSHILKLQNTIKDRDQECINQTKEIERLMEEILAQKNREKVVVEDNTLLTERLEELLAEHENLKEEIFELQDRYAQVHEMYKEAERELFKYREKFSMPQRTMSSDSLYDFLTSEIEIHDSGFYTTPMASARSDSRNSNCLSFQRSEENRTPKNHPIEECLSNELAAIGYLHSDLIDCSTQSIDNENTDGEHFTFPTIYKNGICMNSIINNDSNEHPSDPISNISTPVIEKIPQSLSSPIKTVKNIEKVLDTKDVSCSPIRELLDSYYSNINESRPRAVKENPNYDNDSDSDMTVIKLKRRLTHRSKSSNLTDNSTLTNFEKTFLPSNETLSDYTSLTLGVPGKLGTHDLELCITRKDATRKKIQEAYNKHRLAKGLGPSKYPMFQKDNNNQNKGYWLSFMNSLKEKLNFSTKDENIYTSYDNGISTVNNKNSHKNNTITDDIGINTLTIDDSNEDTLNGVVSRTEISSNFSNSSASTPIKTYKSGKISRLSNASSFSLSRSLSSGKDFLLLQTSLSRCSSPITTKPIKLEPSIDYILSGTESHQKNSGVIERIDIFSEIKNNQNQNE